MHNSSQYDIIILGAGITGLSLAYYLEKLSKDAHRPLSICILEASDRCGGKIWTESLETSAGSFLIEKGPDSFQTMKPQALQLANELGLQDELITTGPNAGTAYLYKHGNLLPLPPGIMSLIPTQILPFALSPIISPVGKCRMALDALTPKRKDPNDESIADFVTRRLGTEALEYLAEPLLSGIYSASPESQSLLATFPHFRAIEQKHGCLLGGMLAARKAQQKLPKNSKSIGPFLSFKKGMQTFSDTLVKSLSATITTQAEVAEIQRTTGGFQLSTKAGQRFDAKKLVLSLAPHTASQLLADLIPGVAPILDSRSAVSSGSLYMAYSLDALPEALRGSGVLIPRHENLPINAITFVSTKFAHRAPPNTALLRLFLGGMRNPTLLENSDDYLLSVAQQTLKKLFGISSKPLGTRLFRLINQNPLYEVGHLEHMEALAKLLPPEISLLGSPYGGVGIPDCIRQAQSTAQKLMTGF